MEIARRAEARYQQERAEYEEKMARREARKQAGKAPKAPESGPRDKDQVNLTDEESRIMPTSGGGFEQAYNAQASVDNDSGLIITRHVTQATNDQQEIKPTLAALAELEPAIGKAEGLVADAGYFSEASVNAVDQAGLQPSIAMRRDAHNQSLKDRFAAERPETGRRRHHTTGVDELVSADKGWSCHLQSQEMHHRTHVRHTESGDGLPAVSGARLRWRGCRVGPALPGVQSQTDVQPDAG